MRLSAREREYNAMPQYSFVIIDFSDHLHLIERSFSFRFHMSPMFLPSIRPEKIHDFLLILWPMDLYEDCRMTSTDRFQSALYRVIFCALNVELDHRWIDIQRINRDCANQRGISSPSIIRRIRYWLMIEAVTHRAIGPCPESAETFTICQCRLNDLCVSDPVCSKVGS